MTLSFRRQSRRNLSFLGRRPRNGNSLVSETTLLVDLVPQGKLAAQEADEVLAEDI